MRLQTTKDTEDDNNFQKNIAKQLDKCYFIKACMDFIQERFELREVTKCQEYVS